MEKNLIAIYGKMIPGWGKLWIAATQKGICHIQLNGKLQELLQSLPNKSYTFKPLYHIKSVFRLIESYLCGEMDHLDFKIDLLKATPFQKKVWKAAQKIPYGEKKSYLWVAKKLGHTKAPRAVGQALKKNPIPLIIPCHRVIASHGKLGGFTPGTQMKRRLLALEFTKISI